MSLSEAARVLWAKSPRKPGDDWRPLIAHLLDVAASAAAILEREPSSTRALYAADLGLDQDQALAWVCALAGLHDLGKASPAFQQKWRAGKERVWATGLTWSAKPTAPPDDVPHNVISQFALPPLLGQSGWPRRAAMRAADAIGAHHGFRADRNVLNRAKDPKERGAEAWDAVRAELFSAVLVTVGVSVGRGGRIDGAAFERIAGLTSFADWIGSSLPRAPLDDDLTAYYQGALNRARRQLDAIGWAPREPLLPPGRRESLTEAFSYLGTPEHPFAARPLQELLERLLEGVAEPALFLVEAPMGEGKTEAAFYAHLHLQAANRHRGLYVALPTQATGNAMFARLDQFLAKRAAERGTAASPLDLQLLHGASLLNRHFQSLAVQPNLAVEEREGSTSPDRPEEGVHAAEWFTHRKRALLSEYGVGTVDQALLAILATKHQFVRLWGLGNRVVVLDEVHAYDTYTGGLIESLVRWLRALGSSVVLLSATLPAPKRRALLAAWGAAEVAPAAYPRITRAVGGAATSESFPGREQPTLTVRAAPYEIADLVVFLRGLVRDGGCAACIVNTVRRAQDLYQALAADAAGLDLSLFHARYPADERLAREEATLRAFGERGERPARAILIATQVAEQSLDLDFDVLVTDLAPVDLILQRAGRLHRHDRDLTVRRGHKTPIVYIAGLQPEATKPELGDAAWVYDEYVLLRSWLALRDQTPIALPDDIDRLVQAVYSQPEPAGLAPALVAELRRTRGALKRRDSASGTAAIYAAFGEPDEEGWLDDPRRHDRRDDDADDPQADDDRPPLQTRRGRPSVTVIPVHAVGGRYYLDTARTQEVRFGGRIEREDAITWYGRSVRLSNSKVVKEIEAHALARCGTLAGWRKAPLLAQCSPLILDDGHAVIDGEVVRLDPQLGIVYER